MTKILALLPINKSTNKVITLSDKLVITISPSVSFDKDLWKVDGTECIVEKVNDNFKLVGFIKNNGMSESCSLGDMLDYFDYFEIKEI